MKKARLSHVDARGAARMVDVADKPETARTATASATVKMKRETLRLVERATGARGKGDVLAVARLAGIMAARRTAELIPLCHPIRLTDCQVDLTTDRALPGVRIRATARAVDRTGVEMEAMLAATTAALTVYDMVKGAERETEIGAVRLEEKAGGRSGHWRRGAAPRLRLKPIARGRASK
ncbi:MAG TPA: cyclic pyranopterin monophosphate synthase MoaC [Polyangia bacterium]|nr:cyclic pyranopterin monophosphate synthase MoaC [Polyangia bacterium]